MSSFLNLQGGEPERGGERGRQGLGEQLPCCAVGDTRAVL